MSVYKREQPSSRTGFVRHAFGVWFFIGAITALTACGGGGGGGGGGNPAPANPPANQAPQVNAGADQTIQLPTNNASLTGSATDAAGTTLTYTWSSSPADGVTFANASAAQTTATFAAAGTYTLTLTVSDAALTGTDTVIITVQPASGNTAPTVSAGADQTIQLPTNQAQLSGSATDAENNTLTYAWTSDPAGVSFADAAAASTTATFPAAGTFTLTLTANDGQATGSDSLTVVVQAAGELFWPAPDTDESVTDRGWTRVTPAEVGMDAARLEQAAAYAMTAGGAGMVVKGGRLVHSWATGTTTGGALVDIDSRFPSQSATKSIGGMALGFAIDGGIVALTDRARLRLPTFGQPPDTNDVAQLETITILQLATHTAGFEKEQTDPRLLNPPGTTWSYSDGALNWLADVLTTVFNRDLRDVLTERVWGTLGVNLPSGSDDVLWRNNASRPQTLNGVTTRELSSGISINANAMARVGLLYLRNGMWSTGQVLPESFITTSKTPPPEIASAQIADPVNFPGATTGYGVLWWTNKTCQLAGVPADAYWAWGQYESLIVVIPSLDLVISRIGPSHVPADGRVFGEQDWNGDYAVLEPFLGPIVAATGATGQICVP
jgi:CubicO group peptidase (beta-lactamase class C family)